MWWAVAAFVEWAAVAAWRDVVAVRGSAWVEVEVAGRVRECACDR